MHAVLTHLACTIGSLSVLTSMPRAGPKSRSGIWTALHRHFPRLSYFPSVAVSQREKKKQQKVGKKRTTESGADHAVPWECSEQGGSSNQEPGPPEALVQGLSFGLENKKKKRKKKKLSPSGKVTFRRHQSSRVLQLLCLGAETAAAVPPPLQEWTCTSLHPHTPDVP